MVWGGLLGLIEAKVLVMSASSGAYSFVKSNVDFYMAVYKYPGYETSQGWTRNLGSLRGILGEI